jgi:ribosomal protein S21
VGGAVRHNLVVDALRRLRRQYHSEAIFARLRRQRQRAP